MTVCQYVHQQFHHLRCGMAEWGVWLEILNLVNKYPTGLVPRWRHMVTVLWTILWDKWMDFTTDLSVCDFSFVTRCHFLLTITEYYLFHISSWYFRLIHILLFFNASKYKRYSHLGNFKSPTWTHIMTWVHEYILPHKSYYIPVRKNDQFSVAHHYLTMPHNVKM